MKISIILFFLFIITSIQIKAQQYIKENLRGEDVSFEKYEGIVKNIDGVIFLKKNGIVYKRIFDGSINIRWFGAKGDGVTNDSEAVQKAINTCFPIKFNKGVYLVSNLKLPLEFAGLTIEGAGFNHWKNNEGTVLKAADSNPIISPDNGCDWVKFSNLRFEGNNIGTIGYNGIYGGGATFQNVSFYNFKGYGIYSNQGLLRIAECFFANNKIGVQLYSDSSITNTEITGGEICLWIFAGGNRGSNLWLNGSSKNLLVLQPDEVTGNQNTSLNNIYLGEIQNATTSDVAQVLIKGNSRKRVQQVQISNSFFVHATETKGSNSIFNIENADEVIISNNNILGQHTYLKKNIFTNNFVYGKNSNYLKITNNIIKGINNSAIVVGENSYDWSILGNDFIDCAGGNSNAIIQMLDNNGSRALINNNKFVDARNNVNVFALKSNHDNGFFFEGNQIVYPNSTILENKQGRSTSINKNNR